MTKSNLLLALVLPVAVLVGFNQAEAKHRGAVNHDTMPVASQNEKAPMPADCKCSDKNDQDCKCSDMVKKDCKCSMSDKNCSCDKAAKKHDKKMKNQSHWLQKETKDVGEDYNEAVYKINKSQLSAEHKEVLKKQAMQNRDLMMKQAKEKADMMMQHKEAREAFRDEIMKDKSNRKAVKEVEDIL